MILCIVWKKQGYCEKSAWPFILSIAEEDEDEQKDSEVAKLLKEVSDGISTESRRKEGRKGTSLEAATFKELNIQSQEGKID